MQAGGGRPGRQAVHINAFLLFWVSIGSKCLSGNRLVSVVVDSYENLMAL